MHACVVIIASVNAKLLKYIKCTALMCHVNSYNKEKFDYNALSLAHECGGSQD